MMTASKESSLAYNFDIRDIFCDANTLCYNEQSLQQKCNNETVRKNAVEKFKRSALGLFRLQATLTLDQMTALLIAQNIVSDKEQAKDLMPYLNNAELTYGLFNDTITIRATKDDAKNPTYKITADNLLKFPFIPTDSTKNY